MFLVFEIFLEYQSSLLCILFGSEGLLLQVNMPIYKKITIPCNGLKMCTWEYGYAKFDIIEKALVN